jgi:hypothetical protein
VDGRPVRLADRERELAKHLVFRLTDAMTSLDICVIHLRRPIGSDGIGHRPVSAQARPEV